MFRRAKIDAPTPQQQAGAKLRTLETKISGNLNIAVLQKAYGKVIKRHDCLSKSPQEILQKLSNTRHACQAVLVSKSHNEYTLSISFDTNQLDEQSIATFFSELSSYYNNHKLELELPPATKNTLGPADEIVKSYWQAKLDDLSTLNLVTQPDPVDNKGYGQVPFSLNANQANILRKTLDKQPIEKIICTALIALLNRHCAQSDITVGYLTSNRRPSYRPIGNAAQQLPVRVDVPENCKFDELLNQTSATISEACKYQLENGNYKTILNKESSESLRSNKAYDVAVSINDYPPQLFLKDMECTTPRVTSSNGLNTDIALFELRAFKSKDDGSINGHILFNKSNISAAKAEQITAHLKTILHSVALNPNIGIQDLSLLLDTEQEQIEAYNRTHLEGRFSCQIPDVIHDLAILNENAQREMLVFHAEDGIPRRVTYEEFDIYTTQIANHLRETYSLQQGDRILVSVNRSYNTFAYIFGAMKAGLIPIPIESKKSELFAYKVANSNTKLAVVDKHTYELCKEVQNSLPTINTDDPTTIDLISRKDDNYYSRALTDDDPAYIMYSSGSSTGIPKKSTLTHGGLRNLLNALTEQGYENNLSVICTAPADFDAFLFDFLVAWATSGTIHITPDAVRTSPEVLSKIIKQEKIDYAVVLPELMSALPPGTPLKYLITMGAPPREEICQTFLQTNNGLTLINGWGLTEAGICQSLQDMIPGQDSRLIGRPIANMQMHVVDKHMNICPPEVPGEIYLSGPGLATEYDNNPELTASKFFTARLDPKQQRLIKCSQYDQGAMRYFSTGDIGYYQADPRGSLSLKCVGRTDRRIKFCGVSLDLNAIENVISASDLVESVAVKPDDPKNIKALHAFVVPKAIDRGNYRAKDKELRRELRALFMQSKLPPIACPQFVTITAMPLTKNGKKNYHSLKKPNRLMQFRKDNDATDLLMTLKALWKGIIGCDDFENHYTWEELGGHSLGLTQLEKQINSNVDLDRIINFTYFKPSMTVIELCNKLKPLLTSNTTTEKPKTSAIGRSSSLATLYANTAHNQKELNKNASSDNVRSQSYKN